MANSKEELYVLLDHDEYRIGKAGILNSQADSLRILKHLHNLKVFSRQKSELKKELLALFEDISWRISSIEGRFPKPKVPKSVRTVVEDHKESKVRDYSKRDNIDEELASINEKLKGLNG